MQWNETANAGFSTAKPWLPAPPSYKTHNVAAELNEPGSVLNFYRQLLALRHTNPALLDGDYLPLAQDDPNVLAYLRRAGNHMVMVALNLSGRRVQFRPQIAGIDLGAAHVEPLLTTTETAWTSQPDPFLALDPYSVYIGQVHAQP